MESLLDRILQIVDNEGTSIGAIERKIGASKGVLSRAQKNGTDIQSKWISQIVENYPLYSAKWLLTGEGDMLLSDERPTKKQIPLYDVQTIGGKDSIVANMDPAHITDMIDAGDWFPQATAAMHHYGDSMLEYPSGCILVLRRVNDRNLLINGRNYVIETDEYRVTKMIRDEGDYLMAYSTNEERLADGSLKHAPFKIYKESIRSIDLVIGCVIKDFANKPILIK